MFETARFVGLQERSGGYATGERTVQTVGRTFLRHIMENPPHMGNSIHYCNVFGSEIGT